MRLTRSRPDGRRVANKARSLRGDLAARTELLQDDHGHAEQPRNEAVKDFSETEIQPESDA
jgi:hypothetical protein